MSLTNTKKSGSKPGKLGLIVIENQNDEPSANIIISNTSPDDLDPLKPSQITEARKKNIDRIAQGVAVKLKSTSRVASANKNAQSSNNDDLNSKSFRTNEPIAFGDDDQYPNLYSSEPKEEQDTASKRPIVEGIIGRMDIYRGEEETYICYRFPHLKFCCCPILCEEAIKQIFPVQIVDKIYLSSFQGALSAKNLLKEGITHVLNLSATEYTKRTKWFKYLNLDVYDIHDEDIKKYFRITNRFIQEATSDRGKVLIHCYDGKSTGPAFLVGYLIGKMQITFKKSLDLIKASYPEMEINEYFLKQLEQYDLEKLAFANTFKKA